jgi:hypothetical protein
MASKTKVFKFPFSNLVFVGTIGDSTGNVGGSSLMGNPTTGYGNGQGSVLTVSAVTTGGNNIIYTPPTTTAVLATTMTAGLTYVISALGNTDFTLCGAPANQVGVKFTATVAGIGTGKVLLSMDSLLLNGPGIPEGTHIIGNDGSGTPGGASNYYLDNVVPILQTVGISFTQGRHFRNQVSAIASFPENLTEGIQTAQVNQFGADTGSAANCYLQGSIDGVNWLNLSSAMSLSSAAPGAAAYQSSASSAYTAFNNFRLLNGTVTGLSSIGGSIRGINLNTR